MNKIIKEAKNELIVKVEADNSEHWIIPHAADTAYFTHGYFRYIGKFPPQIASKLIDDYYPGKGKILDPMVGGGTVLIESILRGIKCEGWDINPTSILIAKCVSRHVESSLYQEAGEKILNGLSVINNDNSIFNYQGNSWIKKDCT